VLSDKEPYFDMQYWLLRDGTQHGLDAIGPLKTEKRDILKSGKRNL